MNIERRPVIDIIDLERDIIARHPELESDIEYFEIRAIMFDDDYNNDCYKAYFFGEDVEYKYSWQNEEKIKIENIIRAYLREVLPDEDHVSIDVSW